MKGCILDAGSLGPGVDLAPILATLPEWQVWDATKPAEVASRVADFQVVLTNKVPLAAEHFRMCKKLSYISVLATGTNNIDLAAAQAYRVPVSNVRHYSTDSVVQHTLTLMLALANNLLAYSRDVTQLKWQGSPFFCYFDRPILGLKGKVLTIVGFGSQGQKLAALAEALGMVVQIAQRPGGTDDSSTPLRQPFHELLPTTDVLSFHCPLTDATANLLNVDNIFRLKKGALVINCARGGIVNEEALALALARDHLGGAAIDVATAEPPPVEHVLMKVKHPNFILTPHIAWGSLESRQLLINETAANILAFRSGNPRNLVSP